MQDFSKRSLENPDWIRIVFERTSYCPAKVLQDLSQTFLDINFQQDTRWDPLENGSFFAMLAVRMTANTAVAQSELATDS